MNHFFLRSNFFNADKFSPDAFFLTCNFVCFFRPAPKGTGYKPFQAKHKLYHNCEISDWISKGISKVLFFTKSDVSRGTYGKFLRWPIVRGLYSLGILALINFWKSELGTPRKWKWKTHVSKTLYSHTGQTLQNP